MLWLFLINRTSAADDTHDMAAAHLACLDHLGKDQPVALKAPAIEVGGGRVQKDPAFRPLKEPDLLRGCIGGHCPGLDLLVALGWVLHAENVGVEASAEGHFHQICVAGGRIGAPPCG